MLLDTSVVIDWIEERHEHESSIAAVLLEGRNSVAWPTLSELVIYAQRKGRDAESLLEYTRRSFDVIPLVEQDFIESARIRQTARENGQSKFSIMDGLILACARRISEELLTIDQDFNGLEGTKVLR